MKSEASNLTLVLGGTGKTGRRIVAGLEAAGREVRVGSRSGNPAFDWNNDLSWDASLDGVTAAYINFAPDLAIPGATDAIEAFCRKAKAVGVKRVVLLSGRGEEEAQACERIVQDSGLDWTIIRASWFNQNFSEGAFVEMVQTGTIALPAGDALEPFVDVDDLADIAVSAFVDDRHIGELYEVTGPRLMSLADVAAELSVATEREIKFIDIPHSQFVEGVAASGAPREVTWMLDYLFATVLDGRNSHVTDGVERALGRPPKDFADYAREVARSGVWNSEA